MLRIGNDGFGGGRQVECGEGEREGVLFEVAPRSFLRVSRGGGSPWIPAFAGKTAGARLKFLTADHKEAAQTVLHKPQLRAKPARRTTMQQSRRRQRAAPPDHPAGEKAQYRPEGAFAGVRVGV